MWCRLRGLPTSFKGHRKNFGEHSARRTISTSMRAQISIQQKIAPRVCLGPKNTTSLDHHRADDRARYVHKFTRQKVKLRNLFRRIRGLDSYISLLLDSKNIPGQFVFLRRHQAVEHRSAGCIRRYAFWHVGGLKSSRSSPKSGVAA